MRFVSYLINEHLKQNLTSFHEAIKFSVFPSYTVGPASEGHIGPYKPDPVTPPTPTRNISAEQASLSVTVVVILLCCASPGTGEDDCIYRS